jgi:single-strand DNA-binding protein
MNKVELIGNLTSDPKTTDASVKVAKFTLAVKRNYANEKGEYDSDFINIVAFKKTAELCEKYLKKGNKCAVIGKIQTGSYTATDGTKKYTTDIIADEVEFLTAKTEDTATQKKGTETKLEPIDEDQIPF